MLNKASQLIKHFVSIRSINSKIMNPGVQIRVHTFVFANYISYYSTKKYIVSAQQADCHIWLVDRLKFASLEAILSKVPITPFSLSGRTELLLIETLSLDSMVTYYQKDNQVTRIKLTRTANIIN